MSIRISVLVYSIYLFSLTLNAQSIILDSELKEISGLEIIHDSILVAINDGGNSAHLYLLNHNGKITKRVWVKNATNIDWEDIASDDQYIYIADIGNNLNNRKDLCIYRIKIEEILNSESVNADKMHISYRDQAAFPPADSLRNFDSECLIFAYGDLWIFSKNNSIPFDGKTKVYRFKFTKDTSLTIPVFTNFYLGNRGFYFDTPTAGDFRDGKFFLSTYNRWMILELKGIEFTLCQKKKFTEYNQKEALVVGESAIWVANEFNKHLGGPKLKRIPLK